MRIEKAEYQKIANMVVDILVDYSIKDFPLDLESLCKKMGVDLIKYGDKPKIIKEMIKLSNDAFSVGNMIFVNEAVRPQARQRFSICHELKHYVCNDTDADNEVKEKLADFFARAILCPTPILVYRKINDVEKIMSMFSVTRTVAENAISQLNSRRRAYGEKIFDYEKPLINLVEGREVF